MNCMDSELVWKPQIDMKFNSIQNLKFYFSVYAAKIGFDVRKQYYDKNRKDGEIITCKFLCCKKGVCKKYR